ncbi:MAG: SDR family NAD(P)-dependent oxidoreductase [Myxococcota bacterium]
MSERSALVTGVNRGIGQAIARALCAQGMRVFAAARTPERAEEAAAALGHGAVPVAFELSERSAIFETLSGLQADFGPVDGLVNNAAVLHDGQGLGVSAETLAESFAINVAAPFALIHALAPSMQARGYGRIVNLSSGWGAFAEGMNGPTAYAVSKAALNALTLNLAGSLGPNVKINAACPGWVRTRMGGASATLSPEEGADTAVWLATLPDDGPTGGFFRNRQPIDW